MKVPNTILQEIVSTSKVPHPSGELLDLTSASSAEECEAMYNFLLSYKPITAIEIGMAYGVSSLTILTALSQNQTGSLISVDPYPQWESARIAALHNINRAGLSNRHQHLHLPSEIALPRLANEGIRADFVYIDGHHGFDHAFVDWFYADLLVHVGGVIAFDDSRWRSVHKVIKYMLAHRRYQEIDVGLSQIKDARSFVVMLAGGRRGPSRYFKKIDTWSAPFNFHKNF